MNNRDRYKLKGIACLAASQVLQDLRHQATASQLGDGYPKLAERAEETREDTRNGANEESPPKTQLCG
jgi:hypothetical protein